MATSMADKLDDLLVKVTEVYTDMKHVREKTDVINDKVEGLAKNSMLNEFAIQQLKERMDKVEPLVVNHEELLIEGKGAQKAVSGIVAVGISVVSSIVAVLSWVLK